MVRAVLLIGGLSTRLRPMTLSLPLPLLEFCNETLLMHQLRALKEAGVAEVLICVHERVVPGIRVRVPMHCRPNTQRCGRLRHDELPRRRHVRERRGRMPALAALGPSIVAVLRLPQVSFQRFQGLLDEILPAHC